mmetsp:Transcript_94121/g.304095  ORF Transcript_94121/g.304095 Transcript_94121/m.304095 type:complete len:263 (+) Transcript_94121:72-860(+)
MAPPAGAAEADTAGAGRADAVALLARLDGILQAAKTATDAVITDEDRRIAEARYQLGDALWTQEEDAEGAIDEFAGALARNPQHVDSLCGLASVLGERGDLDGAIKALRRALAIAPRHGLAHFYLGSALGRRGDFDGAVLEFRAVVEHDPGSSAAALARRNLEAAARAAAEHPLTYEAGMSREAREEIGGFSWGAEDHHPPAGAASQSSCSICIKDFAGGDRVRQLRCGHVFHAACVDEWLRRCADCPLCKGSAKSSAPSSD